MGAGTTEVRDTTTDVLLEAAVWDPAAVSRTQRRLHLVSEASRRYERTVDPAISAAALDRSAALLADIAGGTVERTLTDWRGDPPRDDWSPAPVSMPVDLPDRTAGVDYPEGTTERRLTQIGARVTTSGDEVTATPPSWRPDLKQPADLVEEVLRLEGLDKIPSVLPLAPPGRGLTADTDPSPCHREGLGAQRVRRDPAHPVPACRGVRHLGACRRRSSPRHHGGAESAGVRPAVSRLDVAAGHVGGFGAQRVSGDVRRCAVRHRADRRGDAADATTPADPRGPPPHRRRDRHHRRLPAAAAVARRRGADRSARTGGTVGTWTAGRGLRRVRGGPDHRPCLQRRIHSARGTTVAVASGARRRGAAR